MHDMAEHTSSLISIIGVLVSVVGFLVWRSLVRIETKLDENCAVQTRCQKELPEKYATKDELREHKHEFKDWKEGRDELWGAINHHTHDEKGRVIR